MNPFKLKEGIAVAIFHLVKAMEHLSNAVEASVGGQSLKTRTELAQARGHLEQGKQVAEGFLGPLEP